MRKISYIDISFIVHATEDQEKALIAAKNIFPPEHAEKISFNKSKLKGEYGNPIILFKTQIREPKVSESFLLHLSLNLPSMDKEDLVRHLHLHLDRGSLYMRLDKQEAYKGRLKFHRADPIRIHVKFKTKNVEEIRETCRAIGLLP